MLKQYFKIKEFVLVQSNSCPITITAFVTFTSNPNAAITTSPIIEALSFSTNSNKALLARKHLFGSTTTTSTTSRDTAI